MASTCFIRYVNEKIKIGSEIWPKGLKFKTKHKGIGKTQGIELPGKGMENRYQQRKD